MVDISQTPSQLLSDVLLGSGVTVTNVTYNGVLEPGTPQQGTGSFVSNGSNLGLPAGIILSSGFAENIAGPASGFQSNQPTPNISDPDLVAIAGGITINNAAVLEFDFIPLGDTIRFRYVFGSEEYPEFVCSFNDAFGFFLSGPGITGPYTNNAINIALLPGTSTPVTIDNVNNGLNNNPTNPGCPATNPEYYIDNGTGGSVVYDGMTVVLEAVAAVQCGETHHIKLAIGDALDQAYDSGVFLEAGSFTSTPFIPSLSPGPGIIGDNTIMESCYPVQIDFTRTGDLSVPSTVTIDVGGTATPGVDFTPNFPAQLSFAANEETIPFIFNCPIDADMDETIILTLTSPSQCGFDIVNEFTFTLINPPPVVGTSFDENIQCGESIELFTDIVGGYEPYTVDWGAAGTGNPVSVTPLAFTVYTATITDDCGTTSTADFNIGLIELPPIIASIIGPSTVTEGCESTQINIIRPQGVPGELTIDLGFSGSAENGSDYNLPSTVTIGDGTLNILVPFQPLQDNTEEGQETAVILISFTDDCGRTVDDFVSINIIDSPPIFVEAENFQIECAPDTMLIGVEATGGYQGTLFYEWNTGDTEPYIWVTMTLPGIYGVTVTDPCGGVAYGQVTVEVDCEIIVPNVFTPNGDGMNDQWVIDGIISQENTVRVYNRWGNVVYETKNYRNTWGALDIPDGTYFYEILVPKRQESPYTGHLTILRNRW